MPAEADLFASPAEVLAASMEMAVEEFVELFGMVWRPAPEQGHDYDADPTGLGNIFGPWYVLGEPAQVMARPDHQGRGLQLGRVRGYWAQEEMLQAVDRRTYAPLQIGSAVSYMKELMRRRRQDLRYCRYCLTQFGPEGGKHDVCWGCTGGLRGATH